VISRPLLSEIVESRVMKIEDEVRTMKNSIWTVRLSVALFLKKLHHFA